MLRHEWLIAAVRDAAQADRRIVAALMYGSFAKGRGDEHSDVEFYLYVDPESLADLDRRRWLDRIAPVALAYTNEWGTYAVVFDDLVRGEFHFEPATAVADVAAWTGAWFPDVARAVVVDRTGELTRHVEALPRRPPDLDTADRAEFLAASLGNWLTMGMHLLERGDLARAQAFLPFIQEYVLRCARLLAGATQEWANPVARIADDVPEAAERLARCTAAMEAGAVAAAYRETAAWADELTQALCRRHGLTPPASVLAAVERRLAALTAGSAAAPPG